MAQVDEKGLCNQSDQKQPHGGIRHKFLVGQLMVDSPLPGL